MDSIVNIAKKYGIDEKYLELYGKYKAKLSYSFLKEKVYKKSKHGKLILVTAINPTPAGEGKTTISISLTQALNKIGKRAVVALREPSLGPCFGMKGGASGGGKASLIPATDLNLHFTGDFHAITAANNIISAIIDNHIHHGNFLQINPRNVLWKRVIDMNDRPLRNIVTGLGSSSNGFIREDSFAITASSEIMAVFCLAKDLQDLRTRLERIIVAYKFDKTPVYLRDLNIVGSVMALLVDAFKPNLIQTSEGNLAFVHGGPFANIAHGCNSVLATMASLAVGDFAVTEAGFGADLGAEKFFDIKCKQSNLSPDVVVIVATVRALKFNGGVPIDNLNTENLIALKKGFSNLKRHVENMRFYNVPVVVAINHFDSDTSDELSLLKKLCESINVDCDFCAGFSRGGEGGVDLAKTVLTLAENKSSKKANICEEDEKNCNNSSANNKYIPSPYDLCDSVEDKIIKLSTKFYHASEVIFSTKALKEIKNIENLGFNNLPICIAKTPYSFSDNPKLLGAPSDFTINVTNVRLCNGASMIVVELGNIMIMPGLPKRPAALDIDVDSDGNIVGMI